MHRPKSASLCSLDRQSKTCDQSRGSILRPLIVLALVCSSIGTPAAQSLASDEVPPDYRFKVEVLARGLAQPLQVQLALDGRIFFNELSGKLKTWKPGGTKCCFFVTGFPELINRLDRLPKAVSKIVEESSGTF